MGEKILVTSERQRSARKGKCLEIVEKWDFAQVGKVGALNNLFKAAVNRSWEFEKAIERLLKHGWWLWQAFEGIEGIV